MPSPFPGMDPWLESPRVFPDFHHAFLATLRTALVPLLHPPFFAAISTRVYLQDSERHVEPDVDILRHGKSSELPSPVKHLPQTAGATSLLEIPLGSASADEEITEGVLEIRTTRGTERLVTSIELLSLANKARGTKGRRLYLKKQDEMREANVNLVEIDLLRAGTHSTIVPRSKLRRRTGPYDYHICISKAAKPTLAYVAPIALEGLLPKFAIPLTPDVAEPIVNLQAAFDQCYDNAGYSAWDLYSRKCDPPLTPEQQAWAESILREKGILK